MKYDLNYYDFDVFSNTFGEEFADRSVMGFDGNKLLIVGNITFNDKEQIEFIAPVELFRLSADFVDEDDPDILLLNTKAKKVATVFDFSLKTNAIKFGGPSTSSYGENCAAVVEDGIN